LFSNGNSSGAEVGSITRLSPRNLYLFFRAAPKEEN
jgi:hypothetical protein